MYIYIAISYYFKTVEVSFALIVPSHAKCY